MCSLSFAFINNEDEAPCCKKKKPQTRTNQPNKNTPVSVKSSGFPHPGDFTTISAPALRFHEVHDQVEMEQEETDEFSSPSCLLLPVLAGLGQTLLDLPWKNADPKSEPILPEIPALTALAPIYPCSLKPLCHSLRRLNISKFL